MNFDETELSNVNPGQPVLLLPEGGYPARFKGFDKRKYSYGGKLVEKLVMTMEVYTTSDLSHSIELCRYYNITRDRGGRLIFGSRHGYFKDWVTARGNRWPDDPKRLPPDVFKTGLFLVAVRTVRRDQTRRLSNQLWTSRIGWIIRPIENDECFEGLPVEVTDCLEE